MKVPPFCPISKYFYPFSDPTPKFESIIASILLNCGLVRINHSSVTYSFPLSFLHRWWLVKLPWLSTNSQRRKPVAWLSSTHPRWWLHWYVPCQTAMTSRPCDVLWVPCTICHITGLDCSRSSRVVESLPSLSCWGKSFKTGGALKKDVQMVQASRVRRHWQNNHTLWLLHMHSSCCTYTLQCNTVCIALAVFV